MARRSAGQYNEYVILFNPNLLYAKSFASSARTASGKTAMWP
jgi:hypothetical protein